MRTIYTLNLDPVFKNIPATADAMVQTVIKLLSKNRQSRVYREQEYNIVLEHTQASESTVLLLEIQNTHVARYFNVSSVNEQ